MRCHVFKSKYRKSVWFFSLLISALLLSSGCSSGKKGLQASLPPDVPTTWASETTQEQLPISASLLDLINEAPLRALVSEALKNNPNLNATALRLKAAEHLLYGPKSRLMPKVNAGISSGRNNQSVGAMGEKKTTNKVRMTMDLSWEIDLWGRLRDEYYAQKQTVRAQRDDFLLAQDALAARVIQSWIDQVAARQSVIIEAERVRVIQQIENIMIERFRDGIGSLDELSTAKSRSEIAKADLSVRKTELARSIRTLELLLGRYPKGELLIGSHLPLIATPATDIPAAVLKKRPDVRAAMARLESSRRSARAAKKARLPSLQLSGQVFKESARLGNIGSSTAYWGILGSVFQPIFEGKRLKKEAEAGKTEAKAALLDLRHVVLTAINEVEEALSVVKDYNTQALAVDVALKESVKSSGYYEERYRQGLESIQNLLNAKEQEITVKQRLNELLAGKLKNRINLALALGTGLETDDKRLKEL